MLRFLSLTHVGPAPAMELEFGERLNLLTGDNGLGKSFLLDTAWWTLTRNWPGEINKQLPAGRMARPSQNGQAQIAFNFTGRNQSEPLTSTFDRQAQAWTEPEIGVLDQSLVLYAMVDGSFAVWDPVRNYWRQNSKAYIQERPAAYVFSPREIWDGLRDEKRGLLCNGLISDWAGWQKERGKPFKSLCAVLQALSPTSEEKIEPGELTRISLDDPRDFPTLCMPYGQNVPVVHASAGIRRIIALAYLLIWAWEEHNQASKLIGQLPVPQIIFLIDEIEAHLHPKWQRIIVSALLNVMNTLKKKTSVQVIATTHSPLVLASVEPLFDSEKDAWFDLDLTTNQNQSPRVLLSKRHFVRKGDVSNWLTSEAFD